MMTTTSMILTGLRIGVVSLALVACGHGDARSQPGKKMAAAGPIIDVQQSDAEMNAAIARARSTVGELLTRLRQPPANLSYLGVKVRLGDAGARGEHIWLFDVHLDGERITGRLLDDATYFPRFKQGDMVSVLPGEVSDWMTVEGGRACGGFTSRVILPRMTAAERRDYLQAMEISRMPPGDRLCDVEAGR